MAWSVRTGGSGAPVDNFYNREIVLWLTPKVLPMAAKVSPVSRLAPNHRFCSLSVLSRPDGLELVKGGWQSPKGPLMSFRQNGDQWKRMRKCLRKARFIRRWLSIRHRNNSLSKTFLANKHMAGIEQWKGFAEPPAIGKQQPSLN
jgi:hypothetical protein